MIRVTIIPKSNESIYSMLINKEFELRQKNKGTLHRMGKNKKGEDKWVHNSYQGWINFKDSLGGIVVATVQSKNVASESQLLSAFIGFLDRHFKDNLSTITLGYSE